MTSIVERMAAYASARTLPGLIKVSLVAITLLAWSGVDPDRASSQESCIDPGYATDHIIVKMREGAPEESIEKMKALNGEGAEVEHSGIVSFWVVDLPAGYTVPEAVELYEASPDVEYAEPDVIVFPDGACPGSEAALKRTITDTPDPVHVGEDLTYTASVTNLGPDPATNLGLWVGLGDPAEFVSMNFDPGSGQGRCDTPSEPLQRTTCHVDSLGVGETAKLTLVSRPLEEGRQALIFEAWADNGPEISFEISETTEVLAPNPKGCTIFGTEGYDRLDRAIMGTPGRDVICALGGDDEVYGRGGNDVIYAGDGYDIIKGGDGNDALRGGRGTDDLNGGAGKDEVFGGFGQDDLDVRDGVGGNDEARGGPANDFFFYDRGDRVSE